jgi:hypothetical protein
MMSTGKTIRASMPQMQNLAAAIEDQAEALANGMVDESVVYAHVRRLLNNAETLAAWAEGYKPEGKVKA